MYVGYLVPSDIYVGIEAMKTMAIALCLYKSPSFIKEEHTQVGLFFQCGHGNAYFEMDEEDAKDIVTGKYYEIKVGKA